MMKTIINTFRGIFSHKQSAFINLIGLTIGVCSFSLICIWSYSHYSYDRHFTDYNQIHLFTYSDSIYGDEDFVMPFPMAETLRDKFPEPRFY